MPDFAHVDSVPVCDLARAKEIVDRRRPGSVVRSAHVAEDFAEESTFWMRAKVEFADQEVSGAAHAAV
jgi:hypothetical protein